MKILLTEKSIGKKYFDDDGFDTENEIIGKAVIDDKKYFTLIDDSDDITLADKYGICYELCNGKPRKIDIKLTEEISK